MLVQMLLLLGLLMAGSFGPGWFLVRRLRWSLAERLAAAIGASAIVLYLVTALLYGTGAGLPAYWAVAVVWAGLCVAAGRDLAVLLCDRATRGMLAGLAVLFVWMLLWLAMVRSYSGAKWELDWVEHYQRAQYFLGHPANDPSFVGWVLPARPPFMNLLAAFFLRLVGERFEWFQIISLWLNLLVVVPACLLARRFRRRGSRGSLLPALFVLLAASPFVVENATYPWTKGLANFYVLLGLVHYIRAALRPDPPRMLAAFLALSAGVLVHYSAAPYFVLVGLHYLFRAWRRKRMAWREAGLVASACALLLATWIGWSVAANGVKATLGSNTTVTGSGALTVADNLRKIGDNLMASLVPHPLRVGWAEFAATFVQTSRWGYVRDYAFTIMQTNLLFGLGSLGWLAVAWLGFRVWRSGPAAASDERWFWWGLAGGGAVFTVATHPTADPYGVAHVCSQPLLWLGLCFLAANLKMLPRVLCGLVIVGCIVDFIPGILVHFDVQHWVLSVTRNGARELLEFRGDMPNLWTVLNLGYKRSLGYTFLGDHVAGAFLVLQVTVLALFAVGLDRLVRSSLGRHLAPRMAFLALLLGPALFFLVDAPTRSRPILPDPSDPALAAAAATRDFDSADTHINLGLAFHQQGRLGEAALEFVHGLVLQPGNNRGRYYLGTMAAVYRGPVSPAAEMAEAVRLDPTSAPALNNLAVELRRLGHVAAANARLAEAVRLQPDFAPALVNLALSELELDQVEAALGHVSRALQLDSRNPKTHIMMANALLRRGSRPEAVAELREALRLDPGDAEAKAALASLGVQSP